MVDLRLQYIWISLFPHVFVLLPFLFTMRRCLPLKRESKSRYKSGTGWYVYVPLRKKEKAMTNNFNYNGFNRSF